MASFPQIPPPVPGSAAILPNGAAARNISSGSTIIYAESFGVVPGGDAVATANAFVSILAFIATNGPRIVQLPAGTINITVPAANAVAINEGTAIILTAAHSGTVFQGVPGATVIVPNSNRIQLFGQTGASNIVIQGIMYDNSVNGILNNTAKATSTIPNGGVAGLGNGACSLVYQYFGANLTVRNCATKSVSVGVNYCGNYADQTQLVGTLIVEDVDWDTYFWGVLAEQPRVIRYTKGRSRNRYNSINADASIDPGHDLYLTNRPGASPALVMVDNIQSDGWDVNNNGTYSGVSRSSAIKVRKGCVVAISNVTTFNNGKGVEVWNCSDLVVSNCACALAPDDQDTNQAGYEIRDCSSIRLSNLLADVQNVDAWGFRITTDTPTLTAANTNLVVDGAKVLVNYTTVGGGKAPMIVTTQTDAEIIDFRTENYGAVACSRYPVDARSCTRLAVVFPKYKTPGGSSDAANLVSFDSSCVNCYVVYRADCVDVAVTGSTVSNAGTGTSSIYIPFGSVATFNANGTLTVPVAGSVTSPALGWNAAGDYAGLYRTGSGKTGISVNGALVSEWSTNNLYMYVNTLPQAANTQYIGSNTQPYQYMYGQNIIAQDTVNSWYSAHTGNTFAFSRGGTNYIQALTSGGGVNINAANSVNLQINGATQLGAAGGGLQVGGSGGKVGLYGSAPVAKATVTGSKSANAALTSLMTALSTLGLVTDSTT